MDKTPKKELRRLQTSRSAARAATPGAQVDDSDAPQDEGIALPAPMAGSGSLDRLVETA